MMSSEKNTPGPTSRTASMTVRRRASLSASAPSSDSLRLAFSTITIEASTIVPIAIAIPPSDMMLAVMPCADMITNAPSTPRGSVIRATKAERTCSRKMKITSATAIPSSISLRLRYETAPSISGARS